MKQGLGMTAKLAPIFLRYRYVLLALLGAAVLAGYLHHPPSILLAAAFFAAAAVALAQLRYLRLAVVAALAPLPGLAWFAPQAYPFGVALAALMAAGLTGRLLKGGSEEDSFAALFDPLPALMGVCVVGLGWSAWGKADFGALFITALSVLVALPVGAIFLPFGERFHVAANRVREARAPWTRALARLTEARWAFSLCGVTLVFAVLALFEITGRPPPADWIACVAIGLVLQVVTLDWRSGIAGLLSAALLLLYGGGMNLSLLLFVLLALYLSQATRQARGHDKITSWARALEDHAVPIFFAGLGAVLTSTILDGVIAGVDAAASLLAVLLVFPALTLAQIHLLPERRSVEELYKN
jgi:hypothetical protein